MWTPTHVQVTVAQARNLIPKGKGGTNDAYVMMQLGKEKYQTSVKDKTDSPQWYEECDLPIKDKSASILLNVYHRNFIGIDEFLGHVSLPLSQFPVSDPPRSRWYALHSKPGKKGGDVKYRGEIEVKVTYIVQSKSTSELNLSKIGRQNRIGSLKSITTLGDKLKMPTRSNSFKEKDKDKKQRLSAIVEPLVNQDGSLAPPKSPNSRMFLKRHSIAVTNFAKPPPPDGDADSQHDGEDEEPAPMYTSQMMRASSNLMDAQRFSASTPRLTMSSLYDLERGRQSPDSGFTERGIDTPPPQRPTIREPPDEDDEISPTRSPKQNIRGSPKHRTLERIRDLERPYQSPEPPNIAADDKEVLAHMTMTFDDEGFRSRRTVRRTGSESEAHNKDKVDGDETRHSNEELSRFDRTRQPIYRDDSYLTPPKSPNFRKYFKRHSIAVLNLGKSNKKLKRHSSDASDKGKKEEPQKSNLVTETHEVPLLDTREMAQSCGQLDNVRTTEFDTPDWMNDLHIQKLDTNILDPNSKPRSSHSIPESIPEDNETVESVTAQLEKVKLRDPKVKDTHNADDPRRNTIHGEISVTKPIRANPDRGVTKITEEKKSPEVIEPKKAKEMDLPEGALEKYGSLSKEELIKMVLTQKEQLEKKEQYNKDMESYIDNLLVRVMETTPRILQNPYERAMNEQRSRQMVPNNQNNRQVVAVKNARNNQSIKPQSPFFAPSTMPPKQASIKPFKKIEQTRM